MLTNTIYSSFVSIFMKVDMNLDMNHKDRHSKSNTTVNIFLLRSFIHIRYLRNNYMFLPVF